MLHCATHSGPLSSCLLISFSVLHYCSFSSKAGRNSRIICCLWIAFLSCPEQSRPFGCFRKFGSTRFMGNLTRSLWYHTSGFHELNYWKYGLSYQKWWFHPSYHKYRCALSMKTRLLSQKSPPISIGKSGCLGLPCQPSYYLRKRCSLCSFRKCRSSQYSPKPYLPGEYPVQNC